MEDIVKQIISWLWDTLKDYSPLFSILTFFKIKNLKKRIDKAETEIVILKKRGDDPEKSQAFSDLQKATELLQIIENSNKAQETSKQIAMAALQTNVPLSSNTLQDLNGNPIQDLLGSPLQDSKSYPIQDFGFQPMAAPTLDSKDHKTKLN